RQQGIRETYDLQLCHKDGTPLWFRTNGALLTDSQGQPIGYLGTFTNITEERQDEAYRQQLAVEVDKGKQKAEELAYILVRERDILATIMENTDAMLVYLDAEFNFVEVNSAYARGAGYSVRELIGKNHFVLFPNAENQAIFERVRDTGEPVQFYDKPFVYPNQPSRGVTYWDWSLVPVKDAIGRVVGLVFSLIETTERKRAEERLRALERLAAIGEVSGNISHELRNPLAIIDSSIFYLKTKLKITDGGVMTHLDRMKSAVDRSVGIIQSLVNLAQMKEPKRVRLDLRSILNRAIAKSKVPPKVRVRRDFPPGEICINADPEQMAMAFENLVHNAVQAMEKGGELTLTVRSAPGQLAEVVLADTGPGIPVENLDKVFRPLYTTKAQGIGLGLSLVKMIIDRHGGSINIESEVNQGTKVTVRLARSRRPKEGRYVV
ncbi:MAG: PAS domain S-box protein, partial [Dehalococcoidales bacterium]|nr:PAS domain S-box protein [Dehalococcoidales bacterium]